MAITPVTDVTAQGDGSGTTIVLPAINTTVGDLLIVGVKWEGSTNANSASDTAGNTYTGLTQVNNGGSSGEPHVRIFYTVATAANATNVITVTLSGSSPWRRGIASQFTISSGQVDGAGAGGQATSGTALATSAFSTSLANTVVWAIDGGYTGLTFSNPLIGGVAATQTVTVSDTVAHWKIFSSVQSSITANITASASDRWSISVGVFGEPGAAGKGFPFPPNPMAHMLIR